LAQLLWLSQPHHHYPGSEHLLDEIVDLMRPLLARSTFIDMVDELRRYHIYSQYWDGNFCPNKYLIIIGNFSLAFVEIWENMVG
jgi:hypothetical protein